MMRIVPHLFIALFLSLVETSFFASFHGLIRFTPFVFVISVYLVQHHAMKPAAGWMILHGILLDLSGGSLVPFVTLAYTLTAIVAILSAERLFSNRSFYGVIACTFLSYGTFAVSSLALEWIGAFIQKAHFSWGIFFTDAWAHLLTMMLFLVFLYSFAKQIRFLLVRAHLLPPSRQTY